MANNKLEKKIEWERRKKNPVFIDCWGYSTEEINLSKTFKKVRKWAKRVILESRWDSEYKAPDEKHTWCLRMSKEVSVAREKRRQERDVRNESKKQEEGGYYLPV